MTRIFSNEHLVVGMLLNLDSHSSHHLLHVLRAKIAERIVVFNGKGGEYIAEIVATRNHSATVKVLEFVAKDFESPLKINLVQALTHSDKMDYIVQKAVELGAFRIIPVITTYCKAKLNQERTTKKVEHWQKIVISAGEQCGRNYLPEIVAPTTLFSWLSQAEKSDLKLVLDPYGTQTINNLVLASPPKSVHIIIGPEGGLSQEEIDGIKSCNYLPLKLGKRILRTETASLAAISALQTLYGDFA